LKERLKKKKMISHWGNTPTKGGRRMRVGNGLSLVEEKKGEKGGGFKRKSPGKNMQVGLLDVLKPGVRGRRGKKL